MKLELSYPVKPFHLNQQFGSNAAYYARFRDGFGKPLKGHNGCDFMAYHGQPVYAPCDGLVHFEKDSHGGEGMIVRPNGFYDYKGGTAQFNIVLWHLVGDTDPKYPSPIPLDGVARPVARGELIGYADNTGAPFESSGDHLHFGLVPFDELNNRIEAANGFNGCIDPVPYFDGFYANEKSAMVAIYLKLIATLKAILSGLSTAPKQAPITS